jgi:short-subunit dehydrogenase
MNVTLITGASGGIGKAFAERLAAKKHNLLLVARSENKLRRLCDELTRKHSINTQYVALDLTKSGADEQLFDETEKRNLQVDWLINNAGIGSAGEFVQLNLNSELAMIQLNVSALVALTHRYLQPMQVRKSGTIINVASMACFQPIPYMAVYAASKVFVRSFTEAIIEENRPYNIRVMLLCPGATETGFFDAANVGAGEIMVTETETPEQVVDSAMEGLRSGKRIAVSGFKNRIGAQILTLTPNSMITRFMAKQLRPNFEKKQAIVTK